MNWILEYVRRNKVDLYRIKFQHIPVALLVIREGLGADKISNWSNF